MEDAEKEDKEASAELRRAEWAAARWARTDDYGAVASSPSQTPLRNVHSRSARQGGEAFLDGSVSYMASRLRHAFTSDLGSAVFEKATELSTSVRLTSFRATELLSVRQAWSDMDHC